MTTVAEVRLWGRTIGAVSLAAGETVARFEYTSEFAASGIQPAPLTMPLSRRVYSFPELGHECFHGLPGLLATPFRIDLARHLSTPGWPRRDDHPILSTQWSGCATPADAAWARLNLSRPQARTPARLQRWK